VEVPAARLHEGITWVDTPGLGSLASSGAAETAAYLPRCDLGLVLIDAGATLSQEDLVLVQTLLHAGAQAMVLVSKADLLKPEERKRFAEYIQRQFATQLGMTLPLYMVSVVGADAALCDAWFEQALQPLLKEHRAQAAAALKRKVGMLRDAVIQSLEARMHGATPQAAALSAQTVESAVTALRSADGLCMAAERAAAKLADELPHLSGAMIAAAASAIAFSWQQNTTSPDIAAAACLTTAQNMIADHTAKVLQQMEALRLQLEAILQQGRKILIVADSGDESLPQQSGAPLLDAAATLRQVNLQPPALRQILPAPLLLNRARSRLQAQWRVPLEEFLNDYSRRLRAWQLLAVDELCNSFHAHAAPLAMQLETRTTAMGRDDIPGIESELARLRGFGVSA
jgi:hypothetical protein